MAGGCRDCRRCTETQAWTLIALIWRVPLAICFAWNIGLFLKKCPICRHQMSGHANRSAAVGDA
jgi:hypothetical protein